MLAEQKREYKYNRKWRKRKSMVTAKSDGMEKIIAWNTRFFGCVTRFLKMSYQCLIRWWWQWVDKRSKQPADAGADFSFMPLLKIRKDPWCPYLVPVIAFRPRAFFLYRPKDPHRWSSSTR